MGSRNHPCCEKNVNQVAPVATVQQSHVLHVVFSPVAAVIQTICLPTRDAESHRLTLGLPRPSPPSLNSILRI
jgi:hypothetical protein